MKIAVTVKLSPTPEQAASMRATLKVANEAANWVSQVAFDRGVPREYALRTHTYAELKTRGLGAQAAQHVIKKVSDAYTTLRANIKAGNLGEPGSVRRGKAESKPIAFRADSAQPFDDRCLSWQLDAGTVSIWTVAGRIRGIPFTGGADQLKTLRGFRKGESNLVCRDGVFYLMATCEVPESALNEHPMGWLGVDLGIVNVATTSDGKIRSNRARNRQREREQDLRAKLHAKGTKAAKRLLKIRRRKEQRRNNDINHQVSKRIVAEAERTGHGIALETLTGLRDRVRLRKPQRAAIHSWPFHQLAAFIAYKAKIAGVPVVYVDAAYTSQECSYCHHVDKKNRPSQAVFCCRSCGVVAHADWNASRNIAARGDSAWTAGRESRVPPPPEAR
ncbi:RNA-guided endonuclease InsQ/TnpB family protein [Glycomyces buryatensis]|uniref:Transposase n=1 Tax=Glycomyces buryatensis TaxID=2570927 RepID=A0A4S8QKI0_9ACTN|nr:RNA-guided endonuclease TnpB family protein [Glycomyces buryatensis]THV43505.1 transposase [Glycomyces buryatensis]